MAESKAEKLAKLKYGFMNDGQSWSNKPVLAPGQQYQTGPHDTAPEITPEQMQQLQAVRARYEQASQDMKTPQEQAEEAQNQQEVDEMKRQALMKLRNGY